MIFTSESVSEGHPDKIADQISDAILDAALKIDPNARVACEVFCCYSKIIISGEVSLNLNKLDAVNIARNVLKHIGYDSEEKGLDYHNIKIEVLINSQSNEIAGMVKKSTDDVETMGAGDQGIVHGYACNDTKNYMPIPISIANDLVKKAALLRKNGEFKFAYPDMKSQVSIDFANPKKPKLTKIAMSIQVAKNAVHADVKKYVIAEILKPILQNYQLEIRNDSDFILTTFHLGGPKGDTGLTGRKIIVDTYGGWSKHGGGAFSGKDGSKVDRSGAYMARYVCKNLVASGVCSKCDLQIGYLIGYSKPVSVYVDTINTLNLEKYRITEADLIIMINELFDLRPKAMINKLQLTNPIFSETTCYGHVGKSEAIFPWEKLDMVKSIQEYLQKFAK